MRGNTVHAWFMAMVDVLVGIKSPDKPTDTEPEICRGHFNSRMWSLWVCIQGIAYFE